MKVLGIIPARYGSTRLAGKPLVDIGGKPMIQHVYARARGAACLDLLLVATDDRRIVEAVEGFGGRAVMTDPNHKSGTDRCAEVAAGHPDHEIVVNIQGDEPLLDLRLIEQVVAPLLADPAVVMATPAKPLAERARQDPNTVKVVTNVSGDALYFSRSLIPYPRNEEGFRAYEHIGLYCYRRDFLFRYAKLPRTPLERTESLEQLRALEHGYPIRVVLLGNFGETVSVDTPEDLARARALVAGKDRP